MKILNTKNAGRLVGAFLAIAAPHTKAPGQESPPPQTARVDCKGKLLDDFKTMTEIEFRRIESGKRNLQTLEVALELLDVTFALTTPGHKVSPGSADRASAFVDRGGVEALPGMPRECVAYAQQTLKTLPVDPDIMPDYPNGTPNSDPLHRHRL